MNRNFIVMICTMLTLLSASASAKTLVVYYSYTNNSREIVNTLTSQIEADVLEIQPAEKGLKYEANGYALGTQLLNAMILWINHSSHARRASLIQNWLTAVNYNTVTGISETRTTEPTPARIYDLNGRRLAQKPAKGIHIVNGKKQIAE